MGYNAAEVFLIFELKYFHENNFFSKMILTHESGAQEDQFDGKKRPKISWYYPFKVVDNHSLNPISEKLEKLGQIARATRKCH